MHTYICEISVLLRSYLFGRAPFAQTLKKVDRGRPSGHGRGGLGSVRAVCRAWRALQVFFRREWRRFPGFSSGGVTLYQVSFIFGNVGVVCSCVSMKTARLATTLWIPCAGLFFQAFFELDFQLVLFLARAIVCGVGISLQHTSHWFGLPRFRT